MLFPNFKGHGGQSLAKTWSNHANSPPPPTHPPISPCTPSISLPPPPLPSFLPIPIPYPFLTILYNI